MGNFELAHDIALRLAEEGYIEYDEIKSVSIIIEDELDGNISK